MGLCSVLLAIAGSAALALGTAAASAATPGGAGDGSGLRDRVYAVDNQSADSVHWTVSVIDPSAVAVVGEIAVGPQPHHIYPVPGRNIAYVSHLGGAALDVLDMVGDRVVTRIATGSGPRHLEFSPDGRTAYTDDFLGDTITAVDTASGRTLRILAVGRQPNYTVASADGMHLFVANSGESSVTVVDARLLRVVRTIPVGLTPATRPSHPFDLVLTPDGSQVVVTGAGDNSLSFIDTRTLAETASVSIGGDATALPGQGEAQKLNVRISTDGRYAWVGNQANSEWSVVGVTSHRLVKEIPAGSGADILFQPPAGPAADLAIGTARYADHLTVVDPRHPRLVRSVPTAPGSHIVAFNRDWTRGFVTCRPGNAVSVLDLRRMARVGDIPVGLFPDGILYVWFEHGRARTHSA